MPAMEEKGAAQSAGRGAEGKAGSNEEWGGSKGPSGEGGIASLTPEGRARYQSALYPAAQVMQGTRLGTYAGLLGQGIGALGAPMTQPPQQGGQLARNVVGSGMNPATAAPSAVSGQKGAAPSAFPAYFAGQTVTPAVGEALQKYGVVNPSIAGTLLESSAAALNNAMLAQQQQNYAAQMAGGTPSTAPTQMMTPGRMMPQAGAMQTRAAMGQYSPSATPLPAAPQVPMAGSPTAFQYANAADPFTISETMAMLGEPRQGGSEPAAEQLLTNQSTLGQPPAPQPTMSPSEVAAPAPQGMPATSYPVPSSATVPGLGLMSGIQQGIGAIRELFGGGGQPLFGEGGLFPADTRTSEERIADFVSSQAEMSQGDDRVYPEPTTDDSGSFLPGFGPEPQTPAPTTPEPVTPAPPYVYPTGGYPIYGYNSYNELMAAMGMAGGGQVRAGMGNAFAPGSYYARYNPHTRGLGGLRRG